MLLPRETCLSPDNRRIGKYRLLRHRASGGMADVYMAVMTGPYGFKKPVALKLMHKQISSDRSFLDMFIDEARLNARLVHPNIVQIIDFGEIAKTPYIATEYINGIDLSEFIDLAISNKIKPRIDISVYIITEVLKALDYTASIKDMDGNSTGIVHRDITPHNILLSFDGDVKLTDFGIAKTRDSISTTLAGTLKGKLRYMSPEQARGEPLDFRSDLYSAALILFELLTHRQAYAGDTDMTLLKHVQASMIEGKPSGINPSISLELETIVEKALSALPSDRFQTPESFRQALHALYPDVVSSRAAVSGLLNALSSERSQQDLASDILLLDKQSQGHGLKKHRTVKKIIKYSLIMTLIMGCCVLLLSIQQRAPDHKVKAIPSSMPGTPYENKPDNAVLNQNINLQQSPDASKGKIIKFPGSGGFSYPEQTAHSIKHTAQAVLSINAVPWANVYIEDGVSDKFAGITPVTQFMIQPGEYTLLFKNKAFGVKRLKVTMLSGERKSVILRYDPVQKKVKTTIRSYP